MERGNDKKKGLWIQAATEPKGAFSRPGGGTLEGSHRAGSWGWERTVAVERAGSERDVNPNQARTAPGL